MNPEKLAEFATVLAFALVIGAVTMLAVLNLKGPALAVTVILLAGVSIACWHYLRKRFGRGE